MNKVNRPQAQRSSEGNTPESVSCTRVCSTLLHRTSLSEEDIFKKEEKHLDLKIPDNSMSNLKLFPIVIVSNSYEYFNLSFVNLSCIPL